MTPEEAWIAARSTTRRCQPPAALPPSPPVRPVAPPGRRGYGRTLARRLAQARFVTRVLALHQVGDMGMCSCGIAAVLCPYVRLAHEVLGTPVPWDTAAPLAAPPQPQPPARRPSPHPVRFQPPYPPRPYRGEL